MKIHESTTGRKNDLITQNDFREDFLVNEDAADISYLVSFYFYAVWLDW